MHAFVSLTETCSHLCLMLICNCGSSTSINGSTKLHMFFSRKHSKRLLLFPGSLFKPSKIKMKVACNLLPGYCIITNNIYCVSFSTVFLKHYMIESRNTWSYKNETFIFDRIHLKLCVLCANGCGRLIYQINAG